MPRWAGGCRPSSARSLVGAVAVALGHGSARPGAVQLDRIRPVLQTPAWSLPAMVELVVPLAITVLVVQNGQGVAVLKRRRA